VKKIIVKKAKTKGLQKWDDRFYVTTYQMSRDGHPNKEIAGAIGVSSLTFGKWLGKNPILADALERGRENPLKKGAMGTLKDYIYNSLSPELQTLWDEINQWHSEPNGLARIEEMLRTKGKRVRQSLFIHALIVSNFNASRACKQIGIAYSTFTDWAANEPDFHALMAEMSEHKGNFYESALVKLVKRGDSSATLFANRTFNKGRGYGDKLELDVAGRIEHAHSMIPMSSLDLSVAVRKIILQAIRHLKEEHESNGKGEVKNIIETTAIAMSVPSNGKRIRSGNGSPQQGNGHAGNGNGKSV
jgi:hypothetical protein